MAKTTKRIKTIQTTCSIVYVRHAVFTFSYKLIKDKKVLGIQVSEMKPELENIAYEYGDVCLRKKRRKRQKTLVKDLFSFYAQNSSLHGLRYLAHKGLTTIEKIFWIATFTGSIILCSFLIKNVYVKWKTSPVIVTFNERLVSVGEVPFPSVTICSQVKSKATVYNFSKELEKYTKNKTDTSEQDKTMLADISLVCDVMDELELGERLLTNASFIDHISSVAPKLYDHFIFCGWQNSTYNVCDKIFKRVYTSEGLCYNMNGLAAEEMFRETVQSNFKYSERDEPTRGWSLEDGYTGTEENPFPFQGNANGAIPDLEVYLTNNADDYDGLCNGLNSGFKIYIQHPADHPQSSLYYYAALDGHVSSMAISADVLTSASALEDYPPETRQCYFQNDRKLRYFKIYTASNCRAECLSNYTFTECGCVGFFMPHDNSSEICAEGKLSCMESAQNALAKRELQNKINNDSGGCNCLGACNSVEYHAEILKTEFHFKRYSKKLADYFNESYNEYFNISAKYSKIELYFKKPQFVSMRRSELFGMTDFLANIGGLLGVFLGFSFLSLIELFYIISLRLGCSLKRDLNEEKARINSLSIANDTVDPMTVINITE